jgi:site-specific DNA-cytosine methylase
VLEREVDPKYIIPEEWIGDDEERGTERFKKSWRYCKSAKDEARRHINGHEYQYNEGPIPFPDKLDQPSRTLLTSEGNRRPNRVCHIIPIEGERDRYRILTPVETERLNGFDDDWTFDMPDRWRYFCMGNALIVGLVEQMGRKLKEEVVSGSSPERGSLKVKKGRGEIIGPLDRSFEGIEKKRSKRG